MPSTDALAKRASKARLDTAVRHVLVCTSGDCDDGKDVASRIKKGIAKAGLRTQVATAKVKCLGICKGSSVVVVYPEGTWYGDVDDKLADRIVSEHLAKGEVIDDRVFLRNPLRY